MKKRKSGEIQERHIQNERTYREMEMKKKANMKQETEREERKTILIAKIGLRIHAPFTLVAVVGWCGQGVSNTPSAKKRNDLKS